MTVLTVSLGGWWSGPDKDGLLGLPGVERAESFRCVVDAERVGHQGLDRYLVLEDETADLVPLVNGEVPAADDCQQLADDLVAGVDLGRPRPPDEGHSSSFGCHIER